MTREQCINSRRLLGITQAALARGVGVSQVVISTFERTGHMAQPQRGKRDRMDDLKKWFEQQGVRFTDDGEPEVKLRRAVG